MDKQEKEKIIEKVIRFMEKRLDDDCSGHDWWHVWRVWRNAQYLRKFEKKADWFVVELAALLHDIADWKFYGGDFDKGPKEAAKLLRRLKVDKKTIEKVQYIIANISFKGEKIKNEPLPIEGQIVQDSDRLDAIGVIGAARTFAYGGAMGRAIYDPDKKPAHFQNFKQYLNNNSSSINHFHEKLLLTKDLMNTKEGKRIAARRHRVLENLLKEFMIEWEGEDFK